MTPASVDPFSYLSRYLVGKVRKCQMPIGTHTLARKNAISFKVSVSLFVVSSNPGMSMSVTTLPSRVNSPATWTSAVQGSNPIPTGSFEPLARLINWEHAG